jgi:hypothetical protein
LQQDTIEVAAGKGFEHFAALFSQVLTKIDQVYLLPLSS